MQLHKYNDPSYTPRIVLKVLAAIFYQRKPLKRKRDKAKRLRENTILHNV